MHVLVYTHVALSHFVEKICKFSSAWHEEMVQRSCGSGSVPVSFIPAMLGCTKHPSVGTHGVRQSWATAKERIGNSLML